MRFEQSPDARPWSNLASVVYLRTYARNLEGGRKESWADTVERVVRGNAARIPVSEEEKNKLGRFMMDRKVLPGGRGLWMSGTGFQERNGGTALTNCGSAATKLLTDKGWVTFGETVGTEVQVYSPVTKRYTPAFVHHHGTQELFEYELALINETSPQRWKVQFTENHKWLLKNGKTTEALKVGDILPAAVVTLEPVEEAWIHGAVFADGAMNYQGKSSFAHNIRLCGKKARHAKRFVPYGTITHPPHAEGDPVVYLRTGKNMKQLPGSDSTPEYKASFIKGWVDFDGHSSVARMLHTTNRDAIEFFVENAPLAGFLVTGKIKVTTADSNFGPRKPLYYVNFQRQETFRGFKVTSKKSLGFHDVFCPYEPEHNQIVIDHGIHTFNCFYWAADSWENWVYAQDNLMLGGGVGMSVEHRYVSKLPKVKKVEQIVHKYSKDADFIVPDSREGWNELLRRVLEAFFVTGRSFSYSTVVVRPEGEPISGFGGTASGPRPLISMVGKLFDILGGRAGRHVRPIDAADILCCIGEMVVAGNVRRSACIVLGDPWDREYLRAKDWSRGSIPNYRANANWSIVADDVDDIHADFWKTYENGEPYGIVNRKNMQKFGRIGEPRKDPATGTNPCVSGSTEILTDSGYVAIQDVVNQPVKVWNGEAWSPVVPRITGTNQEMLRIKFSSGQSLICTKGHTFYVVPNYWDPSVKTEAQLLKVGDKLEKWRFPVLEGGEEVDLRMAYSQGFYSADGTEGYNRASVYEPKLEVVPHLLGRAGQFNTNAKRLEFKFSFNTLAKNFVPFGWSVKARLHWFAGVLDGDGTVTCDGNVQLTSVDEDFLLNIQKLLNTLGACGKVAPANRCGMKYLPDGQGGSKEYYCQTTYRLMLSATEARDLVRLGLDTKRLKLSDINPNRDASRFVQVTSITECGIEPVVYCFKEHGRGRGIFGGVLTGQCAEISLENGEPCNLVDLQMHNLKSVQEFREAARLMFRYAKRVTCEPYHNPVTQAVVARNRRTGVGLTGCLQSDLFVPGVLDLGYGDIQAEDALYSAELGIPKSVKTTTIKPAGTGSKVADAGGYEGIHPGYSRYMIQRVRIAANDALVPLLKAAGHKIEPVERFDGTLDHSTLVVDFYQAAPKGYPVADEEWTTWRQLDVLKMVQEKWSDNSVSVTVYYRREDIPELKKWLAENLKYLKSISFLAHSDHGFKQAPKEAITQEQYEKLSTKIKPVDLSGVVADGDMLDGLECSSGVCPIR